ncbi:hypothetical protein RRG08_025024 [Elysia crispata]|uniref:Pentatricopeptide repeat-containing protein n=1 Tax=Elysia crispata TaxID=231223 RepID=A0AAE1ANP8_9GAST|nr:hypothetical protein RRG08_025024 [Elysia crispata]
MAAFFSNFKNALLFLPKCCRQFSNSGTLMLLSYSNLGMDHYLRQRIFKTDDLGPNGKEMLLNRLGKTKTVTESSLVALDLNDLIHVAESKLELYEVERLVCLISGSSVTAVSSLRFGASLMRLYHHLNCPKQAYNIYKYDVCRDILGDNTCHKILMDLLYKNQQYHLVLEVFETLRHFNIDCSTLAFGAYYHILNSFHPSFVSHK